MDSGLGDFRSGYIYEPTIFDKHESVYECKLGHESEHEHKHKY